MINHDLWINFVSFLYCNEMCGSGFEWIQGETLRDVFGKRNCWSYLPGSTIVLVIITNPLTPPRHNLTLTPLLRRDIKLSSSQLWLFWNYFTHFQPTLWVSFFQFDQSFIKTKSFNLNYLYYSYSRCLSGMGDWYFCRVRHKTQTTNEVDKSLTKILRELSDRRF